MLLTNEDWNILAVDIHLDNVEAGWWKPYPNKLDRYKTAMMLVISGLAEAVEGDRKDLQDDHLPQYKMLHVEIADAFIRLLDSAAAWRILIYVHRENINRYKFEFKLHTVPEQLYIICQNACRASPDYSVQNTLLSLIAFAETHDIDYEKLIAEKREYNRKRHNHKIDVRENDKHGKKF